VPQIVVNRGPGVSDSVFKRFIDNLPEFVASALTCENPNGKLTAADVELWSRKFDDQWDRGWKNLQIIVFANEYPERRVNLDTRRKILQDAIRALLPPDIHGWVWVRLAPSSFGEF
jgi:hypothetical protein